MLKNSYPDYNFRSRYLANQIIEEKLSYELVVSDKRYKKYKPEIDNILIQEGYKDLIPNYIMLKKNNKGEILWGKEY